VQRLVHDKLLEPSGSAMNDFPHENARRQTPSAVPTRRLDYVTNYVNPR